MKQFSRGDTVYWVACALTAHGMRRKFETCEGVYLGNNNDFTAIVAKRTRHTWEVADVRHDFLADSPAQAVDSLRATMLAERNRTVADIDGDIAVLEAFYAGQQR